ncbi:hypothetical protein AAZX31_19G240700 [Glycine max]
MKNGRRDSDVLPVTKSSDSFLFNPRARFLQHCNKIFVIMCIFSVALDPLFFYIPVINEDKKCLHLDGASKITVCVCVLRTFFDLFYILRINFQFKTALETPFSRVSGRDEFIDDPVAIMKRYLSSHFIIDILSIIPLPQVIFLAIPNLKSPDPLVVKDLLKYSVLILYVPRLWRISQLYKDVKKTTGVFTEKAWAGATFNLFLFMLASHKYLQYTQPTNFIEENMRVKRHNKIENWMLKTHEIEQWMSHRMLPENLRERIRKYEQYQWQENRGVEEEALIRNLPKDLRRDIKRHLCLTLVKKVPMFEKMDEQLLDAMCDRLKPVLYTEKSYIVREEDPVDEMLFIMRGKVSTMTTNGGRTGFFNSMFLEAGDFCGEELLTWALDPNSSSNLPISTRTVETLSEVKAFALMADDLKFVVSQFRRLHSKQLQQVFRFYSSQWRRWAATFIQAAWRRYWKKKIERSLREAEDELQDAFVNEFGSSLSLGALRNLRENSRRNRMQQRLLPLLPPKPAEPDFTSQKH